MSKKLKITATTDDKRAVDLVTRMMAIPGKSGEERRVVDFIRQTLCTAGVAERYLHTDNANQKSPCGGDVGNLILKLPGTLRGPRRLLMAHIDTVPLCVGARPVRQGAFIRSKDPSTGLGGDNRAGASVILSTVCDILRNDLPHPPLTLFWPVQEEIGLLGARYASLSKLGKPKLCFNWDGGAPHVAVIGATGDYDVRIQIDGIASHAGAHPEQGASAVAIAGLAIADLVQNGWHGLIEKGKKVGTSNIGIVGGGEATNVVTPRLGLRAEIRSHDPSFRKKIVEEYRCAFQRAARMVKNDSGVSGKVDFQAELKYESFRLALKEPCIQVALAAIEAVGLPVETRVCNGGLDANWMTARGLPTVTLGCGQQDIHTVNEVLHVSSYLHACHIARKLATEAV